MSRFLRMILLASGLALLLPAAPARAGGHDQDEIREAVERGQVRPLTEILNAVHDKLPGEVIGVEVERERGIWYYELRVVGSDGHLFEVHVDGRTGAIDRIKEK